MLVAPPVPSGVVGLVPSAFVAGVYLVSGIRSRSVMCVMIVAHAHPRFPTPFGWRSYLGDHIPVRMAAAAPTRSADPVSPSKEDPEAARDRTIPDVLGPDLDVVFVGINPGLWSGAVGHHFARPGNRFWKALHGSGFTDRLVPPLEDASLLGWNLGLTNLVARTTATADELVAEEIRRGAVELEARLEPFRPRFVAMLGIGAYRTGFGRRDASLGPQEDDLGGARLWVLPNPSGLNAHYQLDDLVQRFRALRDAVAE